MLMRGQSAVAKTPALTRILLVDDTPAEWQLALTSIADDATKGQTAVVKDKDEALDFLHARGAFRRRASGMPAVVVVGPSMRPPAAFALLKDIRNDVALRRLPVVMVATAPDARTVRSAYEHGVNSLVCSEDDVKIRGEHYAALARFWASTNEPPPGRTPLSKVSPDKP